MEYKVMLVDDDYFVLEYLSKSIRWNELGFFEPQCYQNGMEACQSPAPEQPYVLITDIGMPKMDGIQLIRKLKEAEHSVYPIIISCHDDFDYARQAVKLEVFDYILKESMDAAEVEKMLCRLKEKMDEAGRIRQQTDKLQNKIEQNRYILKEKFLRQTLESPMIREENWYKEMQSFGISDPRQYLLPVYCRILGFQELLSRYRSADTLMFALENVAEEVVGDTATCFRYSKNELFMLFPFKDRLKTSYFQAAEKQCERLGKELRDILQMDVVFLAGDLCRGQKALRCEILRMLEHRSAIYYEGKANVFTFEGYGRKSSERKSVRTFSGIL